ncbi:serine hydrolase domain-containing protein [Lactiplantibacillus nangangensis]|uniref:Serine hydrolase domain-containing protein n=1 Tax=Lactiplantibacillus nangangensis TaxID=2559917 RepID=A0ABW1SHL6_9LACO|nr:serine hydrolase domain-containing protein [Lactiplantibacillus nangangensis]
METRTRQIVVVLFLVFVAFALGIFTYWRYTDDLVSESTSPDAVAVKSDRLEVSLSRKTSFGGDALTGKKEEQFNQVMRKINAKHHIGAYLGIEDGKVRFSGARGYANAGGSAVFRINSAFLVGKYQELINNAILLHYASQGKLNLNSNINTYVSNAGSYTIKKLLNDGSGRFVTLKQLTQVSSNDLPNSYNSIIFNKKHVKDSISADSLIKIRLIRKISGTTYLSTLKKLIIIPLGLTNTRVYSPQEGTQSNDVESYIYATTNGIPSQKKMIQLADPILGYDQLRMSLSDVVISYTKILNNELFSRRFSKLFLNSITTIDSKNKVSSAKQSLILRTHNQEIRMEYVVKENRLLITGSNYPNVQLSDAELFKDLRKLF